MGDEIKVYQKRYVTASDIAKFLGTEICGEDIQIKTVKSIDDVSENALVFSKGKVESDFLENVGQVCLITSELSDS